MNRFSIALLTRAEPAAHTRCVVAQHMACRRLGPQIWWKLLQAGDGCYYQPPPLLSPQLRILALQLTSMHVPGLLTSLVYRLLHLKAADSLARSPIQDRYGPTPPSAAHTTQHTHNTHTVLGMYIHNSVNSAAYVDVL